MKPNRDLTNKIQNNSSLFLNFIKNAISASPKVQKNFLDVSTKVAETILKIIKQENLLIDLNYEGKEFWKIALILSLLFFATEILLIKLIKP